MGDTYLDSIKEHLQFEGRKKKKDKFKNKKGYPYKKTIVSQKETAKG